MGAIRSTGNRTELAFRRALFAEGLRYRLHSRTLPGKPDIVFSAARVVVFVDGDYWHGRAVRENGPEYLTSYFRPSQRSYWVGKILRNVARDDAVTRELTDRGWKVLRYWESELKRNLKTAVEDVVSAVRRNGATRS